MVSRPFVREYGYNWANVIRDARREVDESNSTVVGECVIIPREWFVETTPCVVLNGTDYNKEFHYNGRAYTFCHTGKALGLGVLEFLQG